MKVEKGTVRAPEIGRVWLNSAPLSLRQLRGKVVLVDFWDYTCVNCIRTLPYVQAWHQRYQDKGLVVVGVHTPEFTFAQYESNVERGIREHGLTYAIVLDSNRELWQAFANRCWPTRYLLDAEGYLRFVHFGEGAYIETEQAIQDLLREITPGASLPEIMTPLRAEDEPGAVCLPASPELYLGYRRGRIGNAEGFHEDAVAAYRFQGALEEDRFYAQGQWASTAEYFESAGEGDNRILVKYSAAAVNLVLASPRSPYYDLVLHQDGQPLARAQGTGDVRFRRVSGSEESYVVVDGARMYMLVDNRQFGTHTLELLCRRAGLAAFAFTFTSCVQPSALFGSLAAG
jgi:thiol-disulfide isomerase/thioredoxin